MVLRILHCKRQEFHDYRSNFGSDPVHNPPEEVGRPHRFTGEFPGQRETAGWVEGRMLGELRGGDQDVRARGAQVCDEELQGPDRDRRNVVRVPGRARGWEVRRGEAGDGGEGREQEDVLG